MSLESRLDGWSRTWRGPLLAALIAMVAGLPGLFTVPPLDRDESRFAQATAQMLETGDYVNIRFQEDPRYKKPIGIHWLQAISVATLSDAADREIWAYRIPSLLGAMLAAAACAWGAAAFWGPRLGLFAGGLFGASFLLSTEAFIAKTDAMMVGAVTLAMAALSHVYFASRGGPPTTKRTWLLFWGGLALATLVKGPVGPMAVILTILMLWAWDREAKWLANLRWGWGLILFFAIVGPWAIAITVATDGAFWGAAIGGDLTPKLAGGHERHGGPIGYHTLMVSFLIFPATLLLPAAVWRGWRERLEPGVRFAICWLIPTWIVFELLPTKLVHYTLPTYGALAWLMAAAMRQPLSKPLSLTGAILTAVAATVFSAASVYLLAEFGDGFDVWTAALAVLLFVTTAIVGGYMILRRAAATAMVAAGALGILAHGAFFAALAPVLEPVWLSREVAEKLEDTRLHPRSGVTPGPVEVAGYAEPSLVFALGTPTGLGDGADAADAIFQGRPAVVESREEPAFRAAMAKRGLAPRPAGQVQGLDYTNGDEMTLTIYRPLAYTNSLAPGAPMSRFIEIIEVGARDGLQNEKTALSVEEKLEFIRRLDACGARRQEVVSFVNEKRVPQMAGAEEIMGALCADPAGLSRIGIVLNERGWDRCVAAGCEEANVVVCASDGFGIRNQGASVAEQVAAFHRMAERQKTDGGPPITMTISVAFGDPFDGEVSDDQIAALAREAHAAGVPELALADTIGVADPWVVRRRIEIARKEAPDAKLRMHFHDTRNTGLANAFASVEAGVDVLDASVGGLGGCPFAPNATGNIGTEDLVYMLERAGYETGYDLGKLIETAWWISEKIGKTPASAVAKAGVFPKPTV